MLPPNPKDIPALYARALALQKAGQGGEALAILNRILLVRPKTPEVLFQIGRIDAAAGRHDAAEKALRKALALKPGEAAIWQALYGVLSGGAARKLARDAMRAKIPLGSEAEVQPILALIDRDPEAAAQQAIRLGKTAPASPWPALALGRALMVQGKWAAALGPLEAAHKGLPDHLDAQLALGACLARCNRPVRAEDLLKPLTPKSIPASRALARLYRGTMRLQEAAILLDSLPEKPPQGMPILRERALTRAAMREAAAAQSAMRAAVKAGAPAIPLAHEVANTLQEAGAADAALAVLTHAVEAHPGDAGLRTHCAQLKQSAGDLAGAEAELHATFALDNGYAEAYRAYFAGQKATPDDPIFTQMMYQLQRPDLTNPSRRVFNFAAAKALADLGRTAEVFDHLNRANRLMSQAFPYRFEADLAEARALVRDWTQLQGLDTNGPNDPVLFVTGLPRSGTTLVETILAGHPQVSAGGEMPFLGRALSPAMEGLRAGTPDPELFAQAGARYLEAGRRRTGGTLFTDKAISTFSRVGHVLTALPGARVIVLRRDPRDVGLSLYRNMFPEGLHRYSTELAVMGAYIRLHDALVAFWAEALPDQVHIVDYEALTAEPEPAIRNLIAFCDLPWDAACLSPERAERRIETLSFATARQPIGRSAVAGWRKFEAELQPLIKALDETRIDLLRAG